MKCSNVSSRLTTEQQNTYFQLLLLRVNYRRLCSYSRLTFIPRLPRLRLLRPPLTSLSLSPSISLSGSLFCAFFIRRALSQFLFTSRSTSYGFMWSSASHQCGNSVSLLNIKLKQSQEIARIMCTTGWELKTAQLIGSNYLNFNFDSWSWLPVVLGPSCRHFSEHHHLNQKEK